MHERTNWSMTMMTIRMMTMMENDQPKWEKRTHIFAINSDGKTELFSLTQPKHASMNVCVFPLHRENNESSCVYTCILVSMYLYGKNGSTRFLCISNTSNYQCECFAQALIYNFYFIQQEYFKSIFHASSREYVCLSSLNTRTKMLETKVIFVHILYAEHNSIAYTFHS